MLNGSVVLFSAYLLYRYRAVLSLSAKQLADLILTPSPRDSHSSPPPLRPVPRRRVENEGRTAAARNRFLFRLIISTFLVSTADWFQGGAIGYMAPVDDFTLLRILDENTRFALHSTWWLSGIVIGSFLAGPVSDYFFSLCYSRHHHHHHLHEQHRSRIASMIASAVSVSTARRIPLLVYFSLMIASCACIHISRDNWTLFPSRVFGGIASAFVPVIFEAWFVSETLAVAVDDGPATRGGESNAQESEEDSDDPSLTSRSQFLDSSFEGMYVAQFVAAALVAGVIYPLAWYLYQNHAFARMHASVLFVLLAALFVHKSFRSSCNNSGGDDANVVSPPEQQQDADADIIDQRISPHHHHHHHHHGTVAETLMATLRSSVALVRTDKRLQAQLLLQSVFEFLILYVLANGLVLWRATLAPDAEDRNFFAKKCVPALMLAVASGSASCDSIYRWFLKLANNNNTISSRFAVFAEGTSPAGRRVVKKQRTIILFIIIPATMLFVLLCAAFVAFPHHVALEVCAVTSFLGLLFVLGMYLPCAASLRAQVIPDDGSGNGARATITMLLRLPCVICIYLATRPGFAPKPHRSDLIFCAVSICAVLIVVWKLLGWIL